MATSGTTTWSLNRDQVIKGALRKLVVIPSGGTPTTSQVNDATEALNALVKVFQADGMPLWKMSQGTFTTVSGTSSYTLATKALRIVEAFYTPSGGINTPLNLMNQYDFMMLPRSTTITGVPTNMYHQPLRTTSQVQLWPNPEDSTTVITYFYQSMYEDMTGASDDFDFPSEWIQPLIYNLAWSLAPEFGIPIKDREMLASEAKYWKDYVLSMGSEEGSLFLQPNWTFN